MSRVSEGHEDIRGHGPYKIRAISYEYAPRDRTAYALWSELYAALTEGPIASWKNLQVTLLEGGFRIANR